MQRLIEDFLAFSQPFLPAHPPQPVDLNTMLEEIRTDLADRIEEKKAVLESGPLPVIRAIPFQMKQLLINLISNALKYHQPGKAPRIRIGARTVTGNELSDISVEPGTVYHEISVSDEGIGFEQKYAARIFDLFQRLHNKDEFSGTGIGLALCKKIVQHHRGHITAQSEPGKGSTFRFYLPADT